jgi:hypothetical protein
MLRNSYYSTQYDYDTEYSCYDEDSSCNQEGVCRCGYICNARVTDVNMRSVTEQIYKQFVDIDSLQGKRDARLSDIFSGGPEVDKYCINRIITHYQVWNVDNWKVNISNGYYGNEIDDVSLNDIILTQVSRDCSDMMQLSSIGDKLRLVLTLEYGYILDDIRVSDFDIISIKKDEIDFKKLNQNHIENVRKEDLSFYSSDKYVLPRGVVRRSGDKYKIIDGFHRITASDETTFKVFCIK